MVTRRGAPAFTQWYAGPHLARLRRTIAVMTVGVVLIGLFWAANSFAWAFGQGRAVTDALGLPDQPELLLDTKEPLVDVPEGVIGTPLPAGKSTGRTQGGPPLLDVVAFGDVEGLLVERAVRPGPAHGAQFLLDHRVGERHGRG